MHSSIAAFDSPNGSANPTNTVAPCPVRQRANRLVLLSSCAQANATLMQIRAPIDGLVVFNTIWKQGHMGEVQEGDQVRPGVSFLQVVDPSLMEVRVPVNQEDLLRLSVGQTVVVRLDAYPDLAFRGRLDSIDPMGQRGDFSAQLRRFSATFSIQGNDLRLMPDLSAAVDLTSETSTGSPSR